MKRLLATLSVALAFGLSAVLGWAATADPAYPGKTWQKIEHPGALGWSASRLARFQEQLGQTHAESVVVVYQGRVLVEYGDVAKPMFLASVRKSLLSMMY